MRKKRKPKILYLKYRAEHQEEQEKQELKERLNAEAVVVNKLTAGAKLAQILADVLRWSVRIMLAGAVLALLSLAVTVLLNEPLRKVVFEFLGFVK